MSYRGRQIHTYPRLATLMLHMNYPAATAINTRKRSMDIKLSDIIQGIAPSGSGLANFVPLGLYDEQVEDYSYAGIGFQVPQEIEVVNVRLNGQLTPIGMDAPAATVNFSLLADTVDFVQVSAALSSGLLRRLNNPLQPKALPFYLFGFDTNNVVITAAIRDLFCYLVFWATPREDLR